jgi:hypothetical protein
MMTKGRYFVGAGAGVAVGALLMLFVGPFSTSAQEARQNASNTLVSCEPSQQVVVRHVVVNNELQVSTQCVGAATPVSADYVTDAARPMYVATRPITATRTVAAAAPVRRATTSARVQEEEPKRSWQKTAMVIGGSAGAGAGVGAIAGGKKGALIGAAIGGGAASIFEAIKRK